MNYGCIFVIMVICKKIFQFLHIEGIPVISGIKFRFASVHGNKIGKAFSIDTIVENENLISRLSHGSDGSLQTKNTLTT